MEDGAVSRIAIALACLAAACTLAATTASGSHESRARFPKVVKGAGDIAPKVRKYRRLLGADNGGGPTRHRGGRREINWDAVPDQFAAPNALPATFFNASSAPRARGAVLRTPGDHVAVSADSSNPAGAAVRFGDVNPTYTQQFRTFSAERLFSPIGSNVVNLTFRVPGTNTRAAVRGFGAVYTDINDYRDAKFRFFSARGRLLGAFAVPVSKDKLSFLGVVFRHAVVARVRIAYGNRALGPNDGGAVDVAVMDDFIYGEPKAAG
jgi:hypothetical protein